MGNISVSNNTPYILLSKSSHVPLCTLTLEKILTNPATNTLDPASDKLSTHKVPAAVSVLVIPCWIVRGMLSLKSQQYRCIASSSDNYLNITPPNISLRFSGSIRNIENGIEIWFILLLSLRRIREGNSVRYKRRNTRTHVRHHWAWR